MIRRFAAFLFAAFLAQNCASAFAQSEQRPMTYSDEQSQGSKKPASGSEGKPAPRNPRAKPKGSSGNSTPKWEVEFHGGISSSNEDGGWVAPPSAETYLLAGSGAKGYSSIRVSSWYFGDGAKLIGSSSSLDSILTKQDVDTDGQMLGFRASRAINRWMAAEFSFDRSSRLKISNEGLAAIESARAGFKTAWKQLDVPGNTLSSSVSTVSAYGGNQTFATGAMVISWPKEYRVRPYATVGAGVLSTGGNALGVTLAGSYGGPSALETDTVRLNFVQGNSRAFTGVVGVGIKIYMTKHFGLRLDGRAYFYKNPVTNVLDANHTNTTDAAWVVKASGGSAVPNLQLLTGPGISSYSTLSGPPISGSKTFFGTGFQRLTPVSVGFFWRF
jgi:hypothetical protein